MVQAELSRVQAACRVQAGLGRVQAGLNGVQAEFRLDASRAE